MKKQSTPYRTEFGDIKSATYVESSIMGENILTMTGMTVTAGSFGRSYYQEGQVGHQRVCIQFLSAKDKDGVPLKAFSAFLTPDQAKQLCQAIGYEMKEKL